MRFFGATVGVDVAGQLSQCVSDTVYVTTSRFFTHCARYVALERGIQGFRMLIGDVMGCPLSGESPFVA